MRQHRHFVITGLILFAIWGHLLAQPERVAYFPDTGRYIAQLDPGDELLQRNVLISNREGSFNVSFALSFDQQNWGGYGLAPRYSSIFGLQGREGCFVRLRTRASDGGTIEVIYNLVRGRCYSIYWNIELRRWDVTENRCRS